MAQERRLQHSDRLFIVLLGVLATALGYQFGFGNQTEHLPLVLRAMDPTYLQNDFFVENASGFGPRFYYVHLFAFFAQWVPLPIVSLATTLIVNTALVAVTHLATRDLLHADRLAGFIAAILVVSVSSFPLGLVTDIRFTDLQPGSLAIPGCLAALWAGLRGKPVWAASLAAASSLPHPLYGIETGAIALATAFCVDLFEPTFQFSRARLASSLIRCSAGAAILFGAALLFWAIPVLGQSGGASAGSEIIDILAHFRSPHHYIPSLFPFEHYVAMCFFLATFGMSWWAWRETRGAEPSTVTFLIPPTIVLIGCLAGYLLVEVWPSRLGMTAQPFRMLYLVKWLGYLFLGWLIARWIRDVSPRASLAWIALLGSGAAQAPIAFISVLAEQVDGRVRRSFPAFSRQAVPVVVLVATVLLFMRAGKIDETLQVVLAMAIALPLSAQAPSLRARALPVALVALIVLGLGVNRSNDYLEWRFVNPIVTWDDHRGDQAEAAAWVRDHTQEHAIFLVPPAYGSFRIMARRAVVVDFEALPFEDAAMREWRQRIRDSYGEVSQGGFAARRAMQQNYAQIGEDTLEAISTNYDAGYAVLYADTDTARPVLYANATYKIISLE